MEIKFGSNVKQLLYELQEASGDADEFGLIHDTKIGCRSGDCCIRLHHDDGWEYAKNGQRHETPLDAWKARNKEPDYQYTVITKENAISCDADPAWFENHPDWAALLRSDKKWPGRKQWICGGGATVREARRRLEDLLRELLFRSGATVTIADSETFIVMPVTLIGKESITVIKD